MDKRTILSIEKAISDIQNGWTTKVYAGDAIIYKVPSNNPKKYVIRVDIKVEDK